MNTIDEVEAAISASGFSQTEVLREARLPHNYIRRLRSGDRALTESVVRRTKAALVDLSRRKTLLEKGRKGDTSRPWESASAAQYRMAVAYVATMAGVSPRLLLDADPARRATADVQWLRAANLRRIALYIANQFLFAPQADLARAAGMSKANVCVLLGNIEDMRGDAELERMLAQVEEAFR